MTERIRAEWVPFLAGCALGVMSAALYFDGGPWPHTLAEAAWLGASLGLALFAMWAAFVGLILTVSLGLLVVLGGCALVGMWWEGRLSW